MDVRFKEVTGGLIETVLDVASCVVVTPDIYYKIVLCDHFIAFYQFRNLLFCINKTLKSIRSSAIHRVWYISLGIVRYLLKSEGLDVTRKEEGL